MSESTSTSLPTTRRPSGRARAGIGGGIGLAAAIAATLVISGTAGAATADETGSGPSSMVVEGSGASDATGAAAGGVPTDLDTVAPGHGAEALVEEDVVSGDAAGSAAGPASMVIEGSSESDAVGAFDPTTGVTVIEGDMLIAPRTAGL